MNNTKVVVTGVTDTIGEVPIDWHGRPSVVTRSDGVVVMAYSSLDKHVKTVGGGHIRFTDDYGATWTDADKTLLNADVTGSNTDGEPFLFDAPNGNLILMLGRCWTWDRETADGTYQTVSTDGGETWSEPAKVAVADMVGDQNFLALLDDTFIYDGVIYLSGRISTDGLEAGVKSVLVKSIDNGANWVFVSDITSGLTNEANIEYLGNNRIIALCRSTGMAKTIRLFSDDMGLTWSDPEDVAYMMSTAFKTRLYTKTHLEGGASWWEDTKLITGGFNYVSATGRRNSIWMSEDAGLTWSQPLPVDDWYEDAGYGDIFWNPTTQEVVFMCYRGNSATTADLVQYNLTPNWSS